MEKQRGSAEAIRKVIKYGNRISVDEMASIADVAHALGGGLVSVDAEDDWCGTGRIKVPWPPKKDGFLEMLISLAELRINFEVLINGVPNPEEIVMVLHRQTAMR